MLKNILLPGLMLTLAAAIAFAADGAGNDRDAILRLMRRANDWQKAHPIMKPNSRTWIRATWYTGVMAAYQTTGDQSFLDQALEWGRQHQWQLGNERLGSNRLFCTQTWAELYLLRKDPAMIKPTVEWLKTPADNSPAGSKTWYAERSSCYVDSLYGAPVFAMLAQATGDAKYLDTMHTFFREVTEQLYDKDDHLYYRDARFIGKKSANGKKIFWSRGNGWVFAGIARVLQYLPPQDAGRPRYVELLEQMSAALAQRQGKDGLWRPNLDDPDEFTMGETSGTGFFCYGLAWGVNRGVLDRARYLPVIEKAWAALAASVDADGKVRYGQTVGDRPQPVKPDETHEYVTGTFLLAGSEMYRLRGGQ